MSPLVRRRFTVNEDPNERLMEDRRDSQRNHSERVYFQEEQEVVCWCSRMSG